MARSGKIVKSFLICKVLVSEGRGILDTTAANAGSLNDSRLSLHSLGDNVSCVALTDLRREAIDPVVLKFPDISGIIPVVIVGIDLAVRLTAGFAFRLVNAGRGSAAVVFSHSRVAVAKRAELPVLSSVIAPG